MSAPVISLDAWELCLRDGRLPEALLPVLRWQPAEACRLLRTLAEGAPRG